MDAKIKELTEAALILHLTTAGLIPGELTNKIKPLILEELRTNPNPKANHLRDLVEKIKGIEADHFADGNKHPIRQVTREFKCRTCQKTHSRGECQYVCKICKRTGHKEEICWEREELKAPEESKNKGDGKKKEKKRKRAHFKKTGVKKVVNSDTETDADSSAPSDSEEELEEVQPRDQKIRKIGRKPIIKTLCRMVKRKNGSEEHLADSVSACLEIAAPLMESVNCDQNSSEDSEDS